MPLRATMVIALVAFVGWPQHQRFVRVRSGPQSSISGAAGMLLWRTGNRPEFIRIQCRALSSAPSDARRTPVGCDSRLAWYPGDGDWDRYLARDASLDVILPSGD